MSWSIYDVNLVPVPRNRDGRQLDRDTSLPLRRQVVGDRIAFIHVTDSQRLTAVKEHSFRRGSFSSVNVSDDANVPSFGRWNSIKLRF